MKKRSWVLVAIALCGLIGVLFVGCKKEPVQQRLSVPQNLRVERRILYFDAVEGADGYTVWIGENVYQLDEPQMALSSFSGDVTLDIRVAARSATGEWDSPMAELVARLYAPCAQGTDEHGFAYRYDEALGGYELDRGTAVLRGVLRLPDYFGDYPVKSIKSYAFCPENVEGARDIRSGEGCNTETTALILPQYLERIGEFAFAYLIGIKEVNIPEGVREIPRGAFCGCATLHTVVFPDGVKVIGEEAFCDVGLHSLTLPRELERIKRRAFYCGEYYFGDPPVPDILLKDPFDTPDHFWRVDDRLTVLHIPEKVREIGEESFVGRTSLTEIRIFSDQLEIFYQTFNDTPWFLSKLPGYVIQDGYFYKLKINEEAFLFEDSVVFPEGIKVFVSGAQRSESIGSGLTVIFPDGCRFIEPGPVFKGSFLKVVLPQDLLLIPKKAFLGTGHNSFVIPKTLEEIGESAFERCRNLTEICLPATLKKIGARAFYDCEKLEYIYYEGDAAQWQTLIAPHGEAAAECVGNATVCFYSQEEPEQTGSYWHYNEDGEIERWP